MNRSNTKSWDSHRLRNTSQSSYMAQKDVNNGRKSNIIFKTGSNKIGKSSYSAIGYQHPSILCARELSDAQNSHKKDYKI